jgi:uncharacterized protein (TIGR04255 family)
VTKLRFQPVSGTHAIEIMAIGIEWAMPLTQSQLAHLQTVYEATTSVKEFLPQYLPVQGFSIQQVVPVGAAVPGTPPQPIQPPQFLAEAGGFDLRRVEPDGRMSWVTSVRPQVLSCNCSLYDRWNNVKPTALSILGPFVNAALDAGAKISAVGLQYKDAFRLLDGNLHEVTRELFRQDCRWLPGHVFDEHSFWHCHQGWFSEGPDGHRVLNNVTTDISEINAARFARIGGQHRVMAVSFDAKSALEFGNTVLDPMLDFLHGENKNVINGMLTDAALESIGCVIGEV